MEKKRTSNKRHVWFTVGAVTDKMLRDLRELARREKTPVGNATQPTGEFHQGDFVREVATARRELSHASPLSRCNGAAGGGGLSSHGARPGLTEPTTPICDAGAHRSVGPTPIMPSAPARAGKGPSWIPKKKAGVAQGSTTPASTAAPAVEVKPDRRGTVK